MASHLLVLVISSAYLTWSFPLPWGHCLGSLLSPVLEEEMVALLMQMGWMSNESVAASSPHKDSFLHMQPGILGRECCVPSKQADWGKKSSLWLSTCSVSRGFFSVAFAGQCRGVLSWRRQMDRMTPLAPLESCSIGMPQSISLGVIFDLQCAFVFNFLYIIKLCSTQQAADLDVLGAHQVICLGCTIKPDGYTWNSFISISLGGLKLQLHDSFLGIMMSFNIPILDTPVLKFLFINFLRIK